jgi:hypothetical protein
MRETAPALEPGDVLALQALLYASGELEGEPCAAFEARLGQDQAARDALCQAVSMTLALERGTPLLPDPAYRERVRQRLAGRRFWPALFGKRTYRGHPALWSVLGAAAALLLAVGLGQFTTPEAPAPMTIQVVAVPVVVPEEQPAEFFASIPTPEEAQTWAELTNRDHLEKAREEEVRRRNRVQDLQLLKNKNDDRRHRILSNAGSKR